MEEDLANQVKELLSHYNYIVETIECSQGQCEAHFPNTILINNEKDNQVIKYKIENYPISGVYINDEFLSCPEYCSRLMILCDIMRRMRKIGMSEILINCYDNDGNTQEKVINEPHKDEEIRKKEGFLSTLIIKGIEDGFPTTYNDVAESHGVFTGYRLLKSFF